MGTQSSTNPMRQPAPAGGANILRLRRRVGAGLLACALAYAAVATAQPASLPLVRPAAIAFDAAGDLFIADPGGNIVREVSATGNLSVVAGTGIQGFSGDNGPAAAAALDSPAGLAVDASGNLFIADTHNQRIREVVAATGTIATIAGTGIRGYAGDGGAAINATLNRPTALAFDASGNLYLADTDNHRIRRIAPSGIISTVAGTGVEGFSGDGGPATAAAIDSPNGLALDSAGNLYIADTRNGRVREVDATTGLIASIAGTGTTGGGIGNFSGDGSAASTATLARPSGLSMDAAGNLYLADRENHRIRRIAPSGVITTVAGDGVEGFAGDSAPATAALLNTPRSVAVSPGGLVTLADSGDTRVRQLDALPAPGPDIHTIPWVSGTAAETLTLTGPATVVYGSGSVAATLSLTPAAAESITLTDTSTGSALTLGVASLNASGSASFTTGTLAAGAHLLVAVYAGDATLAPAQSSALAVSVTPLAITATPNPAAILYGQPVPLLTGTLAGVLTQDAGKVAATFTTNAGTLSPAGVYPIAATLTGSAAANYAITTAPASLTIAKAPTLSALSASAASINPGASVTLTAQVTSTTSGDPTGNVTLLDGSATLAVLPVSPAGSIAFTTSALAAGTHAITAAYSGDSNFLASTSAAASVAVGTPSDFTLTPTGSATQSVPAGSAATYNFAVTVQGTAMASPILLAVQGVPAGSTASLSPTAIVPGATSSSFTLTVQTPFAALAPQNRPGQGGTAIAAAGLLALLLPVCGFAGRAQRLRRILQIALLVAAAAISTVLLSGCGNRINVAPESNTVTIYTLTVTGTATSTTGTAIQHSATVTLGIL